MPQTAAVPSELSLEQQAHVETGELMIEAESSLETYQQAVIAGYRSAKGITKTGLATLARIAHAYGLNPIPGLDLIYMWLDEPTGKVNISISYAGWMAIVKRHRARIVTRLMTPEEAEFHGIGPDDRGAITEILPLDIRDELQEMRELGYDVSADDFIVRGTGAWRKGRPIANGRTNAWHAEKNSIRDAAKKFLAEAFNLNIPDTAGFGYDPETGNWVSEETVDFDLEGNQIEVIDANASNTAEYD